MAIVPVNIHSGAGNILATIDARKLKLSLAEFSDLAKKISSSYVGSLEGVMALRGADNADFSVDFFNPDGSYGAMCGNGARVAVYSAREFGIVEDSKLFLYFQMANTLYKAQVLNDNKFAIHFPEPLEALYNQSLELNGQNYNYSFFNIGGAVHSVFDLSEFTQNIKLEDFDLAGIAPKIRHHADFGERGANVNLYNVNNDNSVSYRTYERGVEAETGACGTGAISTALTVFKALRINPTTLYPPSKSPLQVDIKNEIKEIILSGGVEKIEILDFEM